MKTYACIIIGGGAAGLTAAVTLGHALPQGDVLLLEKLPRVGKKLLSTGNGTCNLTNMHADATHYHGDTALAKTVLARFTPTDTMAFFDSLGVTATVREDGKVYPRAEQAAAVLDCLRLEIAARGVEIRTDCAVTKIEKQHNIFTLQTDNQTVYAKTVLCCTGGAAAPALGGDVEGYALLTNLGHTRTPLFPAIVQLRTDTTFVRAMKGLRVDAAVTLRSDTATRREVGEVLFTDYGISGPAVMQLSRIAGDWERQKKGNCMLTLDLFPDQSEQQLTALLRARTALSPRTLEDFFTGLLHKRIGQTVIRAAGLSLTAPTTALTARDIAALAKLVKGWTFSVTGTQGFGGAQVTAGGINTHEFDTHLESALCQNLFAAGELLNVDGDCGGYNLQFAFASAHTAAMRILEKLS